MTHQTFHRFGAGFKARLRSPRGGGRVWSVFVAFGLLVCAVPALAAEIVEVVQIKGRVFSYKFYVVVVTRVADGFDHGRPGRVDMGA